MPGTGGWSYEMSAPGRKQCLDDLAAQTDVRRRDRTPDEPGGFVAPDGLIDSSHQVPGLGLDLGEQSRRRPLVSRGEAAEQRRGRADLPPLEPGKGRATYARTTGQVRQRPPPFGPQLRQSGGQTGVDIVVPGVGVVRRVGHIWDGISDVVLRWSVAGLVRAHGP